LPVIMVTMKMTVMSRVHLLPKPHKTKTCAKSWAPSQPDSADRPSQPIQRRRHIRSNVKRKLAEIDKER
jgi:hypothetical protein